MANGILGGNGPPKRQGLLDITLPQQVESLLQRDLLQVPARGIGSFLATAASLVTGKKKSRAVRLLGGKESTPSQRMEALRALLGGDRLPLFLEEFVRGDADAAAGIIGEALKRKK